MDNPIPQAMNLAKAIFTHATDGFVLAEPLVIRERMKKCVDCSLFNPVDFTCVHCGCYLYIKTTWASESCPLGLWQATGEQPISSSPFPTGGCCGS